MFTRAVSRLSRKRPPSEIHNNEGLNVPDPNLKGTQKWSSSLDSLLEDPGGVEAFKMQKKAQHIYNTFLSSKASSQVNVEGQSRIGEQILKEPHPLMFEKLQEQIFNLMKYDSYGRFLKSEKFQKLQSSEESETSRPGESAPKRASRIYNT